MTDEEAYRTTSEEAVTAGPRRVGDGSALTTSGSMSCGRGAAAARPATAARRRVYIMSEGSDVLLKIDNTWENAENEDRLSIRYTKREDWLEGGTRNPRSGKYALTLYLLPGGSRSPSLY